MSGYFTRIAKQSGVRFSNGGESRSGSMKSRRERIMPLDREETVMISPADTRIASADERPAARRTEPERNMQNNATPAEEPARRRGPGPTKSTTGGSPRGKESAPAEPVIEEARLVEPDRPVSDSARFEPTPAFSENKGDTIPPEPGSKTQRPVNKEKRQTDTANSETHDKDFFERTSEILEGREAESSAVQTILIQEVQEWIAAGRIPTDDIMADVDADSERQQSDEPQSIVERKPGVIRIGDRKPPDISSEHVQELSPPTAEQLSEQNFEISIGSISVVIEGDEPVSLPAPAVTPPASSTLSASPRTSRLSRHYL